MSTAHRIVIWTARILGVLYILFFIAFIVGEGVAFSRLSTLEALSFVALFLSLSGMVVGWWHPLLGGLLAMGGLIAFQLMMSSWDNLMFNGMSIVGILFILGGWSNQRKTTPPPS